MITRRDFLVAAPALAAATALPAWAQARRISIGTNPAGTNYYVIGGGIAKLFTEKLGTQAIVQPYAGSSVYLPLIQNGEVTMGLSSTLDSGGAYRGEQGRTPMAKLRSLARMWPLPYALMVKKDAPIRSVADLRGRKMVIGMKANIALEPIHHATLAAHGMKAADLTPVQVAGIPQGVKAVVEGTVDATWVAVGIPVVKEAHASVGVRYVNLAGGNFTDAFIGEQVPGVFPMRVEPAPALPEVTEPVTVTGFDVFLVGSSDLPGPEVQRLLAILHDGFPGLQKDYPALRASEQALLSRPTNTVPYHPAAIEFYRTKGSWSAQNEAQEKRVTRA